MIEKLLQPDFFIFFVGFLISLSLHESAHAYAAHLLGDETPKLMGRLSLNPAKHWDMVGSIFLPLAGYLGMMGGFVVGWGKPVTVNYANFKNMHRDAMFVALAGPASNFVIAFLLAVFLKMGFSPTVAFQKLILLNLSLGFFNLLPLYPLDGEKVLNGLIPQKFQSILARFRPYALMVTFILLLTGALRYLVFDPSVFIARILLNF